MFAVQFRYETIGEQTEAIDRAEAICSVEGIVGEVCELESLLLGGKLQQ
jgi:hypothetical protein